MKGTSETILQPYDIRVAHKPITRLRHLLTNVKDKDEPNNGKERFIRSNAPTARPPTNEGLEMVMSTITFLNTTDSLITKSTGTRLTALITYSNNFLSWYTDLEH